MTFVFRFILMLNVFAFFVSQSCKQIKVEEERKLLE